MAIMANERERSIHDRRYFVSFMNLSAIEAAIICRTMEIIRAISLTMTIGIIMQK
jgi:hypothetical protein